MAKFRIRDTVTGKTIVVSGDNAPSEADAEDLFKQAGLRDKPSVNPMMGAIQGVGDFIAPKVTAVVNGIGNTAGMVKDYIDYNTASTPEQKTAEAKSYTERARKANDSLKQFGFDDTKKAGEQFDLGKFLKGSTAGGGELASFYNPTVAGEKVLTKLGIKSLINAVPGVTNAVGNDKGLGDIAKEGVMSSILGTGLSHALPLVGGATKKLLGLSTGVGDEAINRALTRPEGVKAAMRGEANIYDLVPEVRNAVKQVVKDKSDEYSKGFNAIKDEFGNKKIDIAPFKKTVQDTLNKFGAVIKNTKEGLDLSGSSIGDKSEVIKIKNLTKDIQGWKDTSLQGMDILYQRIRNTYDKGASKKFNAIVTDLYHGLEDVIKEKAPQLSPLKKQYAKDTALTTALQKKVEGAGAEGSLSNLFGRNKTEVRALFDALEKKGGTDVLNKVKDVKAGQAFGKLVPDTGSRTLDILRSLLTAGVAGAGTGGIGLIPGLASSSPRAVGEVLTALGSAGKNETIGPLLKALLSGSNQVLRQVGFGIERSRNKK